MEKWQVVALLVVGLSLLLIAVYARVKFGEKYELKTIDLVLIILPLIVVLLVSGKIKALDAFGIKADFSELFSDAAESTIAQQVADKSSPGVDEVVTMLEMAMKGGVRDIPQLVENRTQALVFRLGHGGYYGPAIKQYFDALYASSYLQYLVIKNQNGELFGIYNVLDLAVFFRNENDAYPKFANWLNKPEKRSLSKLTALPGFVGVDQAVLRTTSKRDVLMRMDSLRVESLPVVDETGLFVGTVDRPQLTASLILDVVSRLEGATAIQ